MIKVTEVINDYQLARKKFVELFKAIDNDRRFEKGDQWDASLVSELKAAGVTPLTINKTRSILKLISGIERQSASDYRAFPEGEEDGITADIVTRLLKHITKSAKLKRKQSAQFKNGCNVGVAYLVPYIDYSNDILNGQLKFKEVSPENILFDPRAKEYDLSDAKYIFNVTPDLTKEDLIKIFPDKKKEIDNLTMKRLDVSDMNRVNIHLQLQDYPNIGEGTTIDDVDPEEAGYDLVEYYYKSPIVEYYAAKEQHLVKLSGKEDADRLEQEGATIIKHNTTEVRLKQMVGVVELTDEVSPFYPKYKDYPIIPFFAEHDPNVADKKLSIQGITRTIKDLNIELNKRRTQKLRHLNSTINSGFIVPKDALDKDDLRRLKSYGSAPGFTAEYDPTASGGSTPESWRVRPQPLSQGHEVEAQQNTQDIKESSGVNPDLLANDSQSQSGRAILLKQRQGLVMAQELLDNYSHTKEIVGKFIVTQLGEAFTVEKAVRVIGEGFIERNFKRSVQEIFQSATRKFENREPLGKLEQKILSEFQGATPEAFIDPNTGQPIEVVDKEHAGVVINQILNDAELGKYEVAIGEGAFHETVQMANFAMLQSMVESGVPVPPEVLVEESTLSQGTKAQIVSAIRQAQQGQQIPLQPTGKQINTDQL